MAVDYPSGFRAVVWARVSWRKVVKLGVGGRMTGARGENGKRWLETKESGGGG